MLSPGQKIYLSSVITAIVIICLICFLVFPLIEKVKITSAIFWEKNRIFSLLIKKDKDYLAELEKEHKDYESSIILSEKAFLDSDKAVEFIFALELIALQTGNKHEINEIVLPGTEKKEGILPFQVSLWGSFPDLIRFLVNLENMTYLVDVDSIQIKRLTERDVFGKKAGLSIGDVESIMRIKVYTK